MKAKEGVEDLQTKIDLDRAYNDLGKTAFDLIESGELAHERLDAPAAKVRELRERQASEDEADARPEPEEPRAPAG